ncbi:MAG: hypothetical protein EHM61_12235 [Acidobacteria bacterium]|nr:MAG: hypothetical protein EHM61_12235 [Acidobacteriota bacterium]
MSIINRRSFVAASAAAFASASPIVKGNAAPDTSPLPTVRIGKQQVTRLIIGGNPFSGNAHSEPLVYGSSLFKKYFTHEKVVETLQLAFQNGITTFLGRVDDNVIGFLKLYEKTSGRAIPWFAQTAKKPDQGATRQEVLDNIRLARDNGAVACYLQGVSADYLVAEGRLREIEEYLSFMTKLGMTVGIGAHENRTVQETARAGLRPEFYMKTINSIGYYSENPGAVPNIMSKVSCPWIAFKVLAAGRIRPEEGFRYALDAGAEVLCVGMFDFQVDSNVALFRKLLQERKELGVSGS